ncbi:MAG: hypothetical protein ACT4TC_01010 [Myxococcaceae bacterium]
MRFLPAALFVAYAGFCLFCVWGFPPPVDLPAHGAELQTLVDLLRGQSDVAQVYRLEFPIGYGLATWLAIPLAFLTNGAFAIRAALWMTLLLYPLSIVALLRGFGRSPWMVLLGLPLAFNISYWYGLLSGLFAQPLLFFALATFERLLTERTWKRVVLLNLLAAGVMLSHLLAFAVLCVLFGVRLLFARSRWKDAALGLALPVLLSLPKALKLAERAVVPGDAPRTEYAAAAHVNWFFKNYLPEGRLGVAVPLAITVTLLGLWLLRNAFGARRETNAGRETLPEPHGGSARTAERERDGSLRSGDPQLGGSARAAAKTHGSSIRRSDLAPFALFIAMVLLYAITPKTLSGIFLVCTRLPVFIAVLALLLVDFRSLHPFLRCAGVAFVLVSLVQTARFHARFREATAGLAEVMPEGRRPRHGYASLVGREILGSKQIYLQHLGQWVTASRGGVGHDFFADAEHHTVRFREGVTLPVDVINSPFEVRETFDELYLFGEGDLPPVLTGWQVVARAGRWRRLSRR